MARIVKISYEDKVSGCYNAPCWQTFSLSPPLPLLLPLLSPFFPLFLLPFLLPFLQVSIRDAAVEASRVLEEGGVIALPTDTIYGVACSTQCTDAIQRIYSIKGRKMGKPLAICVGNATDVDRYKNWLLYVLFD